MKYKRQKRSFPNLKYAPIHKEEILFLFDVLHVNTIDNIAKETGFGRDFIRKTLDK